MQLIRYDVFVSFSGDLIKGTLDNNNYETYNWTLEECEEYCNGKRMRSVIDIMEYLGNAI